MEEKVAGFLSLHGIFAGAARVLVAISGGADSICLLHLLAKLRSKGTLPASLVCAHVNHRLRGLSSDADERFVAEFACNLGVRIVTRAVDVRGHAGEHRLSVETAARELRLAALAEIAREHDCSWVAAGHQKDDNAETLLHRLRRGTGFRGLAGIRPVRSFGDGLWLARPLLCVTRDEVVRYLRKHGLAWREDLTNADIAYTRNYIRHRLLPSLQRESPSPLVEGLSELAFSAARLYNRIEREATAAWAAMASPGNHSVRIDATGLALLPQPVAIELVRRALVSLGSGERDLTERHYGNILGLAGQRTIHERIALPDGFSVRYESGTLLVARQQLASGDGSAHTHGAPAELNIPGTTRFCDWEITARILERDGIDVRQVTKDKSSFTECLDWDRVKPPVLVRPRQTGDRFEPLGLGATKKVGKFLTTAKVPHELRRQTTILTDQEKILWVCPIRIAQSVKVTERTQRILALEARRL
ncbi:MAG: tRNA lysidine(34) synthetase TilS [Phycisphaerae bacterium]|nr:tRNA lysidine(34) synthetase TilS [Phycisphaerae bacterium]